MSSDMRTEELPSLDELDRVGTASTKSKGKRPYFFKDPDVERVLSVAMAIAGEVAVLRQRMDTIEELLAERGSITKADIDAFEPNQAQAEARGRWTQEYLTRVLRIVQQEREAVSQPAEPSSEDIGHELARTD